MSFTLHTMSLKAQITDDMKSAMRAKESTRLATVRLLLAAIKQKEVDERIELDDAGVMAVIEKMVKQRKDSIAAYEQAQRLDLADVEKAENAILQAYLPEKMSPQAVQTQVSALVAQLSADWGKTPSAADMGKVMAAAKPMFAGKADMGVVSAAIKAALS